MEQEKEAVYLINDNKYSCNADRAQYMDRAKRKTHL